MSLSLDEFATFNDVPRFAKALFWCIQGTPEWQSRENGLGEGTQTIEQYRCHSAKIATVALCLFEILARWFCVLSCQSKDLWFSRIVALSPIASCHTST